MLSPHTHNGGMLPMTTYMNLEKYEGEEDTSHPLDRVKGLRLPVVIAIEKTI